MAVLTPIATLNDNGRGIADLDAALAQAADLTNSFLNDGNTMLMVSNGAGASVTVTIKSATDPHGRGGTADTNNDESIVIPTLKTGFFPFLNPVGFNSGGAVTFTLSAITSGIKIGIYRMLKLR
jgi:hypothetical protein